MGEERAVMSFTSFLSNEEQLEDHEKAFAQWWLNVSKKPRGVYTFRAVVDFLERYDRVEYKEVASALWDKWISDQTKEIPLFKVFMPPTVDVPLLKTLHSGYIGQGPKVEEFEDALSEYLDAPYVLTTITGTAALHLAYRLAGVKGHEVLTSPVTCMATNLPILSEGGIIRWVDVDPEKGNINPSDLPTKINQMTRAIVGVDWGGNPINALALREIADAYCYPDQNIKLIEDAAHAFGTIYNGHKVGSKEHPSDFVAISLQAIKTLCTIEGGILVCKSKEDYEKGKLIRWYGIDRDTPRTDFRCELDVKFCGEKWNYNDVDATIGLEQLKYVEMNLEKQQDNAGYYEKHLNYPGPLVFPKSKSSYWLYTIHVPQRDKFVEHMKKHNIQVSQVHARNDKHTVFEQFRTELPGVDRFCSTQVNVPVGWWLSEDDRDRVVEAVNSFEV